MSAIEAKERPLRGIFSDDYLFEIPYYQRPYAWTKEQAGELLDDLCQAQVTSPAAGSPPYFLGSIVLIKKTDEPLSQIVDGQQRLTTLTILLCVLRDLEEDTTFRQSIDSYVHSPGDPVAGIDGVKRLSVRDRDAFYFDTRIGRIGATEHHYQDDARNLPDSQKRMSENADLFHEKLRLMTPEERQRLAQFMIRHCYLVIVATEDQESAYRIFSVMNDRGLDLYPTDILKADIIGTLGEAERGICNSVWENTEDALGREGFRDLFTHIRMIYARRKAEKSLNAEFRDHVLAQINGRPFIDTVLVPYADAYNIVLKEDYQVAPARPVNQITGHLLRLDNSDWTPAAIAFVRQFKQQPEVLARYLADLERLAYCFFLLRRNINERINRYATVLNDFSNGHDLLAPNSSLQLTPEEIHAFTAALDGPIYEQTRIRLPLLLRLDSLLMADGVEYDHKIITIEHVLPQTPEPDSRWMVDFPDDEERSFWTHKLGNLVLLNRQKNSEAGRLEFDEKKAVYFQREGVTTFALTAQVLAETEWTPEILAERQTLLIDRLKAEWRL